MHNNFLIQNIICLQHSFNSIRVYFLIWALVNMHVTLFYSKWVYASPYWGPTINYLVHYNAKQTAQITVHEAISSPYNRDGSFGHFWGVSTFYLQFGISISNLHSKFFNGNNNGDFCFSFFWYSSINLMLNFHYVLIDSGRLLNYQPHILNTNFSISLCDYKTKNVRHKYQSHFKLLWQI